MAKRCWDLVLLAISFSLVIAGVAGSARNITVDNLDRSVNYTGDWKVHKSSFAYDGAMSFSQDRGATASFTFTGALLRFFSVLIYLTLCRCCGLLLGTQNVV